MTYADAYRLAHILDEQMQRLLDGDGVDQDALAEAHKIAVGWCADAAWAHVVGADPSPVGVATIESPKHGARRKRAPVIQDCECPRCHRTGQAFYVRASGQRVAYCVECCNSKGER